MVLEAFLRGDYSPPGLFWWPQICDFLPFRKRSQRPGDLWCPSRCRRFHEQHDGAGGPVETKQEHIPGNSPFKLLINKWQCSSNVWIGWRALDRLYGPDGRRKSLAYSWGAKTFLPGHQGGKKREIRLYISSAGVSVACQKSQCNLEMQAAVRPMLTTLPSLGSGWRFSTLCTQDGGLLQWNIPVPPRLLHTWRTTDFQGDDFPKDDDRKP